MTENTEDCARAGYPVDISIHESRSRYRHIFGHLIDAWSGYG